MLQRGDGCSPPGEACCVTVRAAGGERPLSAVARCQTAGELKFCRSCSLGLLRETGLSRCAAAYGGEFSAPWCMLSWY